MKLVDLYITDNIDALDQVATKELSKYDSYKTENIKSGLKVLYRDMILYRSDQERCYILTKRYLALVDRLKIKLQDPGYVQLFYAREIREAQRMYNSLREELIERYAELIAKRERRGESPPTLVSALPDTADEGRYSEESELDEFEEKIIYMESMITPKQLYKKINRNDNILILDIRPEGDFRECTLDFQYLINIPPHNITDGISANMLGQSMDPESKQMWDVRDEFDAIILMDWNSNVSYESREIAIIKRALTEWDLNKIYKYPPVLLNGGFYEYIETYPTGVTNVNFQYDNPYYMLDDMLDLDSIAYPEELSTSNVEGAENVEIDAVCSGLNILKLAEQQRAYAAFEARSDKYANIPPAIVRKTKVPKDPYQDPRPGPSTRPDTPTPSPSEESIGDKHTNKRSRSSDDSDFSGDEGGHGRKVPTHYYIDPEKVKRQMESDRLRELENARRPPKPEYLKADEVANVLDLSSKGTSSAGSIPAIKSNLNPAAKEFKCKRLVAKRRGSSDEATGNRNKSNDRRPSVPSRDTKPSSSAIPPEGEPLVDEMRKLDNMRIVGLTNINNTCYMNALLQCLRACPQLRAIFESGLYKRYMVEYPQLLEVVANLFQKMQTCGVAAITPTELYNQVKKLRPMYAKGNHEDCMEFFVFVLNALIEDTSIYLSEKERRAIHNTWYGRQESMRSIFQDLFFYQLRTDRFCHTCKTNTAHVETESALMLGVPHHPSDLRDLLCQYTASFSLCDFVCNTCKRPLEHKRKFLRMPSILVVVLKRYYMDKDEKFHKNSQRITFPLRNFVVGGISYRLAGIALHDGNMNVGHYTACIKDSDDRWIECNDEHVTPIDINSPRIKNLAYAFIYCKSD